MDNQSEQNRFSVQDLWNVLFSQRNVIAAFAVSVLLLTMVTTWFSTPMYASTAVVEVVPRLSHEMKGQGLFSPQPAGTLYLNQQFYRTETDKILSLSSRRRVVERYRDELGYTDLDENILLGFTHWGMFYYSSREIPSGGGYLGDQIIESTFLITFEN